MYLPVQEYATIILIDQFIKKFSICIMARTPCTSGVRNPRLPSRNPNRQTRATPRTHLRLPLATRCAEVTDSDENSEVSDTSSSSSQSRSGNDEPERLALVYDARITETTRFIQRYFEVNPGVEVHDLISIAMLVWIDRNGWETNYDVPDGVRRLLLAYINRL